MQEHISLAVLVNWASMLRADIDGAVWLADDEEEARFYERCAHRSARVIPAQNVALRLLRTLEGTGIQGIVAVVRTAQEQQPFRDNVFRPSVGDVASLLLASKSYDRVIIDICGSRWSKAVEKEIGSVQGRVVWIARQLQRLRQACIDARTAPFDVTGLTEYIRWDNLEVGWDRVTEFLAHGGLARAALDDVRAITYRDDFRATLTECDGMDAVHLLAAATHFYRPRGIKADRMVNATELLGALRVAFDLEELQTDKVYWHMKQWERRNPRYPLLGEWRTLDPLGVVWDQRYWEKDLLFMLDLVGPDGRLAALKMDLDNFKVVNDSLGHAAGDEAIRLYCSVVKNIVRDTGEAYRRGGDEVVVLAPELEVMAAQTLAETIRATVESEFRDWCRQRALKSFITASIGLVLTNGNRPAGDVVHLLDDAQRQAKQNGKNRVVSIEA